jgi:hypothetical protein
MAEALARSRAVRIAGELAALRAAVDWRGSLAALLDEPDAFCLGSLPRPTAGRIDALRSRPAADAAVNDPPRAHFDLLERYPSTGPRILPG